MLIVVSMSDCDLLLSCLIVVMTTFINASMSECGQWSLCEQSVCQTMDYGKHVSLASAVIRIIQEDVLELQEHRSLGQPSTVLDQGSFKKFSWI